MRLVDAACNESVLNLSPATTRSRIIDIAESTRSIGKEKMVKEAHSVSFKEEPECKGEIVELKSMLRDLGLGSQPTERACAIFSNESHHTDLCPELQDPTIAKVYAAGGFGPSRPTFEQRNEHRQPYRSPLRASQNYQPQPPQQDSSDDPSTEEMLNLLTHTLPPM